MTPPLSMSPDLAKLALGLREVLKRSVERSKSEVLLLSGGLDTSVLALLAAQTYNVKAVTVAYAEAQAPDLYYSELVAKSLGMERYVKLFTTEEAVEAVGKVVKVLKTFDPMEVRNSVPILIALSYAKQLGFRSVMTGDGGDELFAGYSYMYAMPPDELEQYIKNLVKHWSFSAKPLGIYVNVEVKQPYLNPEVVEYALSIPARLKVGVRNGETYGKWILRKAFEGLLLSEVVWRRKDPIEVGSGSTALSKVFQSMVTRREYEELMKRVKLKDYEQAYYFKVFMDAVGEIPMPKPGEKACPTCKAGVPANAKYCRLCGAYPVWRGRRKGLYHAP